MEVKSIDLNTTIKSDRDKDVDSPIEGSTLSEHTKVEEAIESETKDDGQTRFSNGLVDQSNYLPPRQIIIVLMALNLAVALSFLDQTIVSTSLPSISSSFNEGSKSSYVASVYLLATTATLPIWGRISDIFGRKFTLLCCVAIFLIFSLGAALAPTINALIIFRALQGVGGGGLLTLVLIIISDIVSLKDRGKYQGVIEGVITIANGVGPVLGGVLSERVSWRWCFWINLPLAALTLVVIALFLPLKRVKGDYKTKLKKIDWGGSLLTIISTTLLLLPLGWGGVEYSWSSSIVIGCLVASFISFGLLFLYESKIPEIPIINPAIFNSSTVNACFAVTFIAGAVILTQLFYIPQYLQIVRGDSPIRSGVLVLPLLLFVTAMVIFSGQVIARTGDYKPSICIGYVFWTVGLALLSTMDENTSTAKLVGYLIITALGQGQTLQTTLLAAQAAVGRSEMSVVTSTRNFLRSLGGTISLALAATIINNILRTRLLNQNFTSTLIESIINDPTGIWSSSSSELSNLSQDQKDSIILAYVKGFQTVFHVYIGLMGLNLIIALLFIKKHNLRRDDEKELKEKGKAWIEHRGNKKGKKNEVDVEKGKAVEDVSKEDVSKEETVVEMRKLVKEDVIVADDPLK